MKRLFFIASTFLFAFTANAQSLVTTGEGTARWGFIKLYDAKLKLPAGTKPDEVLTDQVAAQLELCYARSLSVNNFVDGANHALPDNLTPEHQQAVERLHAAYQDVNKNDCYQLAHTPDLGTALILNGQELVRIKTPGFKAVYFGVWLGESPLSDKLKTQLLGDLIEQDPTS